MAESNNTAESELLKTIESASGASSGSSSGSSSESVSSGSSELLQKTTVTSGADSVAAAKSTLSFFLDKLKENSGGVLSLGPGTINKGLMIFSVILFVWAVNVVLGGVDRLKYIPNFEVSPNPAVAQEVTLPVRTNMYYRSILLGRNIFSQPVEKEVVAEKAPAVSQIQDVVKDIKLVGISWSDNEDERFVMLEDTKSQLTYFLQKGQKISKSNVVVQEIFEDKAMLKYNDEEVVIR